MSALPRFYEAIELREGEVVDLSPETTKHVGLVLRMKEGERIALTNGKGALAEGILVSVSKRSVSVRLQTVTHTQAPVRQLGISISPLKNTTRLEWFLEKATELGINKIFITTSENTEKHNVRIDRFISILVSAMIQSQQVWLPDLQICNILSQALESAPDGERYFAHCHPGVKVHLSTLLPTDKSVTVFIGPEGDFSPNEVELAIAKGALPVSLGATRLRTETAGVAAAVLMSLNR